MPGVITGPILALAQQGNDEEVKAALRRLRDEHGKAFADHVRDILETDKVLRANEAAAKTAAKRG